MQSFAQNPYDVFLSALPCLIKEKSSSQYTKMMIIIIIIIIIININMLHDDK